MPSSELIKFQRSLERIDYTRKRMEILHQDRRINETDMDSVYEALFLRAVTSFEAFLEGQFLAILQGRAGYAQNRVRVNMTAVSRKALFEILLQGRSYMQWLPFSNTIDRAKIYLKDGKPFSELDNGQRSILRTITVTRNAIAHKSDHALSTFEKDVIGSQALLPRERKPAGYLRGASSGMQKRFEIYLLQLGGMAQTIT